MFDDAMPHFKLAARIQPHEVKWALMVASCLRRLGLQAEVPACGSQLPCMCKVMPKASEALHVSLHMVKQMHHLSKVSNC